MIGCRGRIFHYGAASAQVLAMVSVVVLVAGFCPLLVVGAALAQDSRPPGEVPPAAAQSSPNPPSQQPGFVDALGHWLEEGADRFKTNMQSAQDKLDKLGSQARETTKDATTAVVGFPNARIVDAREPCAAADNGAPDCQAAAVTLCRGKGFQAGKSLDTRTEQKCKSGRFLLEGRAPSSSECPTQIFVTRAICQ
jgi:hypothetical protein